MAGSTGRMGEQMSLKNQYVCDANYERRIKALMFTIIGMGLGMVLLGAVRACDKTPAPAAAATQIECTVCHKTPVLNTLAKYKKFHRSDAASQKQILAELVRP